MKETKTLNKDIWKIILKKLSLIYSDRVFKETFSNINSPYKIENGIFFLLVENEFIKNKIINIYLEQIEEIAERISQEKIFFKIILPEEIQKERKEEFFLPEEIQKEVKKEIFDNYYQFHLESNYNFENFVVGNSNIFAFKMAKKISEEAEIEKVKTNPLYIFGSVGLGKTHLMQSIGNYILKKKPYKRILYIKADSFIEDFANQLRKEKMEDFNKKYRNIDVLLFDDIQIMVEAKRTQMEFFKLFDYLNLNKKQIVITSDKSVSELNNIMERLTNRFKAGLIVDITKPDKKHLLEILKRKICEYEKQNFHIKIKKEVLDFISSHFNKNVREIEGALFRLLNYSQIYGFSKINLQNAIDSLKPLLKIDRNISLEEKIIEKIKNTISNVYNINNRDLISKKKHYKYSLPRHVAIYIMKITNDFSYKQMSFVFRRTYSSILKSFKKIERKIKEDIELKKVIEFILKKINNEK